MTVAGYHGNLMIAYEEDVTPVDVNRLAYNQLKLEHRQAHWRTGDENIRGRYRVA